MSTKVAAASHAIIRECIGIYALIYYAQKNFYNILHSIIIKRGRTKLNKIWVWGRTSEKSVCLY
jgi:hypothetical protein